MCDANKLENLVEKWGNLYTATRPSRFGLIEAYERENEMGLVVFNQVNPDAENPEGYLGNSLYGAYARQKQK